MNHTQRIYTEGLTVWLTGLSSAGKTTIAAAVVHRIRELGLATEWLDGDHVRKTLCRGLGFTKEERNENVARIAFVADILTRNGIVTIVSAMSPYRQARDEARAIIGRFMEVFVDAPLSVCERRDAGRIYMRARRGELKNVIGVDDLYEVPLQPDVHCRTDIETIEECVDRVVAAISG